MTVGSVCGNLWFLIAVNLYLSEHRESLNRTFKRLNDCTETRLTFAHLLCAVTLAEGSTTWRSDRGVHIYININRTLLNSLTVRSFRTGKCWHGSLPRTQTLRECAKTTRRGACSHTSSSRNQFGSPPVRHPTLPGSDALGG